MAETTIGDEVRPEIQTGLYRHYKGNLYLVLGVARHSETGEWFVVYKKQYDDFGLCIRPYTMFVGPVLYGGRSVRRFTFLSDNPAVVWG